MDVLLLPWDSSQSASINKREEKDVVPVPIVDQLAVLCGRTSLYWTAMSITKSAKVQRIRVLCPSDEEAMLRPHLSDDPRFAFQNFPTSGQRNEMSVSDSVREMHRNLAHVIDKPTIVVSCDLPLVSGVTYDWLIRHAHSENLDSALLYTEEEVGTSQQTPQFRPWAEPVRFIPLGIVGPQLLDGSLAQIERFVPQLERLSSTHKTNSFPLIALTWRLVSTLGFGFSLRLLRGAVPVQEVGRRASRLLKSRIDLLECPDAHVGLSLANPINRSVVERHLCHL